MDKNFQRLSLIQLHTYIINSTSHYIVGNSTYKFEMIFFGLTCRELFKSSTSESVQNKREFFVQITLMLQLDIWELRRR